MKKILISLVLILALPLSAVSVYAASFEEGVGKDEIPYGANVDGVTGYSYTSFDMMSSEEAVAASVPKGYSGYVLALTGGSNSVGITLHASDILVKSINSITFRVYCPSNVREVRATNDAGISWIMRATPSATEEWIEITLTADGDNFCSGCNMDSLADENGMLAPLNLGFRFYDEPVNQENTVYIDSVTFDIKEPDTDAPVIDYDGELTVNTTEGKTLKLDLTAWDEYEERAVAPEYIWSEGALDANGLLVKGTHTCTVRATDASGNASEITLTVNVGEEDTVAPVINWSSDTIEAIVGTRCYLNITASDDMDGELEAEISWSEGAMDNRGRLTEGEHTLTITAADSTGNVEQKTVKVIVVKTVEQLS